jgi:Predicted Zn-dependent hydrolases of the beta-lactamase fold
MEVQFYGGNCITLTSKQLKIVVDDYLESYGRKSISRDSDLLLFTASHDEPKVKPQLLIDHPGEYEVGGVSVYGIAARAHTDESGKSATMYKIITDDIRYLVTGHVYPELSERQLEEIGAVDVMFVPVGGNGFTTDPVGALKLIKEVEPKVVIPTHYHDDALKFEVPAQPLDAALTGIGFEVKETVDKLKLKPSDIGELAHIVVLKRS